MEIRNDMFTVDTNKPLPDNEGSGRNPKYPFGTMGIGHSFLVPISMRENARIAAARWKERHPGWDYTAKREVDEKSSLDHYRIWRIA